MHRVVDIAKEFRYGLRQSRFLILAAVFLFFALSAPVMMKVILPAILKSQFQNSDALKGLMEVSQIGCMCSYMGDVFEIGTIAVAFTLCGIMGQEIKDRTLVLPVCSGKRFGDIVTAKMLVFGAALVLILTMALVADYLYAGLFMGFDVRSIWTVVRSGLLEGLYMVYILSCLVLFGTLIGKSVAAGVVTLAVAYGSYFIGNLLAIGRFLPSGLLTQASALSTLSDTIYITLSITAVLIMVNCALSVALLRRMELNWNR